MLERYRPMAVTVQQIAEIFNLEEEGGLPLWG